jgi:hypothetical protein
VPLPSCLRACGLCRQISVLSRAEEDDFLLLASDGLWDVMANQVGSLLLTALLKLDPDRVRHLCFSQTASRYKALVSCCRVCCCRKPSPWQCAA